MDDIAYYVTIFMYYLFTAPTCPDCPKAKEYLAKSKKFDPLIVVDAMTDQGQELIRHYNVQQAPTLLETGEGGKPMRMLTGLEMILNTSL